jgi:hypothetical protein
VPPQADSARDVDRRHARASAGKSHNRARKSIGAGLKYRLEDVAIRRKYTNYSSLLSCWPALNGISPLCNISVP